MRRSSILLAALVLLGCRAPAAEPEPPADVDRPVRTVSTEIAASFGVATVVRGTVRRLEPDGSKAFEPGLMLSVTAVEGKRLPAPREIEVDVARVNLTDALAKAAGDGEYELVGYEMIEMAGNPTGVERHGDLVQVDVIANVDFHVSHVFVVMGLRPATGK